MEFGRYRSHSNVTSTCTSRDTFQEDDEQALEWAALEKLPTYDRACKGLLHGFTGDFKEIDLKMLRIQEKRELLDRVFSNVDQNEESRVLKEAQEENLRVGKPFFIEKILVAKNVILVFYNIVIFFKFVLQYHVLPFLILINQNEAYIFVAHIDKCFI